jgi:hypothetical protein
MARIRTTKTLGQRVNRTYLRSVFPIPQWRRILTLASLAIALGWLGFYAIARNQTPYTAGSLTPSHAFLGKKCSACHGEIAGIGKKVTDQRCAACHDGPIHQASQKFSPACISCHVDHRGAMQLAGGNDSGCVQCHGNLETKSGKLTVASRVVSFAQHPEFAQVKAGEDSGGLKFNHQKHLGDLGQKCGDCHAPADVSKGAARPDPHSHVSSRALMSNPTFDGACKTCHALTIDDKIAEAAPHHVQPAEVHAFARVQFSKYIAEHPQDLSQDGAPDSQSAWVDFKVAATEKKLKEESCGRCHDLVGGPDFESFVVVPPQVAARWFTKSSFDHSAHKELMCVSCHQKAVTSTVATDVLLPGIATCRQCHGNGSVSAGANCSACHVYHDWSKEKNIDGKYVIEQVTGLIAPQGLHQ